MTRRKPPHARGDVRDRSISAGALLGIIAIGAAGIVIVTLLVANVLE